MDELGPSQLHVPFIVVFQALGAVLFIFLARLQDDTPSMDWDSRRIVAEGKLKIDHDVALDLQTVSAWDQPIGRGRILHHLCSSNHPA